MKNVKILLSLIALGVLYSCSSTKVISEKDETADFSQYKTYSFLGWQDDSDKVLNEFDKKRMHDALTAELAKRNLTYVEEGGDMAFSVFLVINQETSTQAYTNHYGGYGGRYRRGYGYGGHSTTSVSHTDYLTGTVVLDAFDEKTGDQLWQGIITSVVQENPEKRKKSIPQGMSKLMKQFPIQPIK